jgi:fucose 4-O-acetylase-like acetyltransferase
MGVMFLVSGFYCAPSYDRKGSARFLGDRALRVLLPLLVYDFFIQPLAFEIARHSPAAYPPLRDAGVNGFSFYFSTQLTRLGHGAGWFLAVLMMFDLAYVAARLCASAFCCCCSHSRRRSAEKDQEAPAAAGKSAADGSDDSQAASSAATEQQQQRPPFSGWATLAGALGVAALIAGLALLVRVGILIPLGLPVSLWTLVGIQCQPAYIPQYAIAFMLGLAAHRCDALRRLPAGAGPAAAAAAAVLAVAGGVLMTFMPGSNFGHELQRGASTSYVAVYAVWEAFYCVAMWVALLVCGRRWANHQGGRVGAAITGAAYAAYLVHVAVLAALGVAFAMVNWHPAAKCAVVTPLAVVSSWLIGIVLRCIPGVKRVL